MTILLNSWFKQFGFPIILFTDDGSNFSPKFWKTYPSIWWLTAIQRPYTIHKQIHQSQVAIRNSPKRCDDTSPITKNTGCDAPSSLYVRTVRTCSIEETTWLTYVLQIHLPLPAHVIERTGLYTDYYDDVSPHTLQLHFRRSLEPLKIHADNVLILAKIVRQLPFYKIGISGVRSRKTRVCQ